MQHAPLIALISATPLATPPIERALAEGFPEAQVWNLLDDRLLTEAGERGGVTPELEARMLRLIGHATAEGADAVLLTCSQYGAVARTAASGARVPMHGPDDAAFAALLASGHRRVALVASIQGSLDDSADRLRAEADRRGIDLAIAGVLIAGAPAASAASGPEGLGALVADAIESSGSPVDAVLLAQYSLAPAAPVIEVRLGLPVFSGPERAVEALRAELEDVA